MAIINIFQLFNQQIITVKQIQVYFKLHLVSINRITENYSVQLRTGVQILI